MRNSFAQLPHEQRVDHLAELNLGLVTYGLTPEESDRVMGQAQAIGFTPLRLTQVVNGVALMIQTEGIELPVGKKMKQERGRVAEELLGRVRLERGENNTMHFFVRGGDDEEVDITDQLAQPDENLLATGTALAGDPMVLGKVLDYVRGYVKDQSTLAVEVNSANQVALRGPKIVMTSDTTEAHQDGRKADKVMPVNSPGLRTHILGEVLRQGQMEQRREELKERFDRREIIATPKFTLEDWPTDPMMTHLRGAIGPVVQEFIDEVNPVCDPKDLKYQALFRLTTFDVPQIFEGGQELEEYLIKNGAYGNWRNILRLDPKFVQQFGVNRDLVRQLVREQYDIIAERIGRSELPIQDIITPSGIFDDPVLVIQKRNNLLFAVREETASAVSAAVPLEFRQVDPRIANAFHRDLHYIHTPRADMAFGLFVQGEELPFSVVALEKIDRPYKQNVLLFQGYDPNQCYDLTRLYSRPGTPGNTSSSIFASTFNYLRANRPDVQGIMSSFMPSYATGISMTSGGFDDPVLVKPLAHRFVEREIEGVPHYEHMTNRRLTGEKGRIVRSRVPLLPTVELLSGLQPPRFPPLPGAKEYMLETF